MDETEWLASLKVGDEVAVSDGGFYNCKLRHYIDTALGRGGGAEDRAMSEGRVRPGEARPQD